MPLSKMLPARNRRADSIGFHVPTEHHGDSFLIFLVDDDEPSLACRKALLETRFECKVLTFTKGADALDRLDEKRCDLLITDYRMPEMRGDELIARAHQKCPGLAIIMISADSNVPQAATTHVDRFVAKGLGVSTFFKAVESLRVKVRDTRSLAFSGGDGNS